MRQPLCAYSFPAADAFWQKNCKSTGRFGSKCTCREKLHVYFSRYFNHISENSQKLKKFVDRNIASLLYIIVRQLTVFVYNSRFFLIPAFQRDFKWNKACIPKTNTNQGLTRHVKGPAGSAEAGRFLAFGQIKAGSRPYVLEKTNFLRRKS